MRFYFTIGKDGFGPFNSLAEAEEAGASRAVSTKDEIFIWRGDARVEGKTIVAGDNFRMVKKYSLKEHIQKLPGRR